MELKDKIYILSIVSLFIAANMVTSCKKKDENTTPTSKIDSVWCIYSNNNGLRQCVTTFEEAIKILIDDRNKGIQSNGYGRVGGCSDCPGLWPFTTIKSNYWVDFRLNQKPILEGKCSKEDGTGFNGGKIYLNGVLLEGWQGNGGSYYLPSTFSLVPSSVTYSFQGNSLINDTVITVKPIPNTPICPEFSNNTDTIYRTNPLVITNQSISCDSMLYIIPGLYNSNKGGTYTLTLSFPSGASSVTFTPAQLADLEINGKVKALNVIVKAVNYYYTTSTVGTGTNSVKHWRFISEAETSGHFLVGK